MSKKKRPSNSLKRLFEIIGTPDEAPPVNLREAEMRTEMEGGSFELRQGYRKDNECMKMCFNSEAQAKAAARRRLNVGANVSRLRTYFCDTCSAWHLTSQFKK